MGLTTSTANSPKPYWVRCSPEPKGHRVRCSSVIKIKTCKGPLSLDSVSAIFSITDVFSILVNIPISKLPPIIIGLGRRAVKRNFFDIPIYRCPIEVHTVEMAKARKKHLDYFKQPHINASKDQLVAFGHGWDAESWSSWHFNEVIGWVRLYVRWDEIMGDLWEITAPHPRLGSKKVFKCGGNYFKLRPKRDASSAEISDFSESGSKISKNCRE